MSDNLVNRMRARLLMKYGQRGAFPYDKGDYVNPDGPAAASLIRRQTERIEALEREVQTLKTTQDDEALTAAWMAGSASRNDEVRVLKAVVEAARTFLDTSFDIDSLRCPMCRAQHKDGHNRWCWTRPLHDALARLDAQKDKNDD